jgi:CubicO group peptidase (beta-lactamase class C family)
MLLAACSSGSDKGTATATPGASQTAVAEAVFPGSDWETSKPAAEGMDATKLEQVEPYCVEHGCRAVVVVRHGRIVWERYWGGWNKASTDNSWSMAKSVTSALVGIAIADGKIKGVAESASDFIPQWRNDSRKAITIGDLLSMESGLSWTMIYDPPSGDTINMLAKDDQASYAINRQIYRSPATDWYYSDGDAETFSAIIKAATGMDPAQYAQEKLFGPIGFKVSEWLTDNKGQSMTFCCIFSTARDFARFGYLFLRDGRWGDKQVVPEQWVKQSTQANQWENQAYGYFWWLFDYPDVPNDVYEAMGFATKRIYVIPSLDIVAVRLGEGDDMAWNDDSFLKPIVEAVKGG